MPYSYTPTPIYVSPVQLASDGDPASSATIMGPIEQALDNAAAIWDLGAKRLRTVDYVSDLAALTGIAHNEIALVASPQSAGFSGRPYGLWRFVEGATAPADTTWLVNAADASGVWEWVDFSRVGAANGLCPLDGRGWLVVTGDPGGAGVDTVEKAIVSEGGTIAFDGGRALFSANGYATVQTGIANPDRGIQIEDGGALHVRAGAIARVRSGGLAQFDAGSTTYLTGDAIVSGLLQIATNGILELQERIRHEVIRYANGVLNGTPIAITASTADEHILGETPAAPTTIALADPTAVGQRVRFSRTSMSHSATHLTVTASGVSYTLSGGGGDLQWLELVSAYNGGTPTWYPSQYAVH